MGRAVIPELPDSFPMIIRYMRAYHGLTLREVAARAGISHNQVATLERGKSGPHLSTFISMCQALELEPAAVMRAITNKPAS